MLFPVLNKSYFSLQLHFLSVWVASSTYLLQSGSFLSTSFLSPLLVPPHRHQVISPPRDISIVTLNALTYSYSFICFTSSLAHELFEDRELSMQQALNEYLLNTTPNFTGGFKQLRAESVDTELPYVTPDIEQLGLQDAIPVITPFICLTIDSRVVKPACLGPVFTRKQAVPMCSQTSSIQLSAWQHQFAPIQNPKQHKTSGRNVRPKECLANSENVRVKKDIDMYLFLKWNFPLYIQLSHHIDWQLICIPVKIQICYLIQDI